MSIRRYGFVLILFSFIILFVVACSDNSGAGNNVNDSNNNNEQNNDLNNDESEDNNQNEDEKVEIVIAYQWGEGSFWDRYQPIEDYLGNVKIEFVQSDGTYDGFEEIFSAGISPDIIVDQNIFALQDLEVIHYLDDLIEQTGFDISIFDQAILDSITAYDDEGRIIGFPDGTSVNALYYNKEIFDLFGVEYPDPEEPMTWDELLSLARQMTGERNGQKYFGLGNMSDAALRQFAPTATDPDTGEVLINQNEAYQKYFDLVEELFSIPGMEDEDPDNPMSSFVGRNTAMIIESNNAFSWMVEDAEDAEPFDLAPVPVWPDRPNYGPLTGTTPMMITEYSENKEVALKILEAYFEPELIEDNIRAGALVPPLSDKEILSQYLEDVESYEGKNVNAYHVLERPTRDGRVSRWDDYVDIKSAEKAIREGTDVVTALRELEEESDAKIKEAMAAQ